MDKMVRKHDLYDFPKFRKEFENLMKLKSPWGEIP